MKKLLIATIMMTLASLSWAQAVAPANAASKPGYAAEDKAARQTMHQEAKAQKADVKAAKASGDKAAVKAEKSQLRADRRELRTQKADMKARKAAKEGNAPGQ